jgi:hypothetical protein
MSRKRKVPSLLDGKKATVYLERNGLTIRVDDVPAETAGLVAADMLEAVRVLTTKYPELVTGPDTVPGGYPTPVTDDEWSEDGRRRTGFRPQ